MTDSEILDKLYKTICSDISAQEWKAYINLKDGALNEIVIAEGKIEICKKYKDQIESMQETIIKKETPVCKSFGQEEHGDPGCENCYAVYNTRFNACLKTKKKETKP